MESDSEHDSASVGDHFEELFRLNLLETTENIFFLEIRVFTIHFQFTYSCFLVRPGRDGETFGKSKIF